MPIELRFDANEMTLDDVIWFGSWSAEPAMDPESMIHLIDVLARACHVDAAQIRALKIRELTALVQGMKPAVQEATGAAVPFGSQNS